MNIIEALDAALPEIPAKSARQSYPRLHPKVIHKEHIEDGERFVLVKRPGAESYLRLTSDQWNLLELFNGERTYAELSKLMQEQFGVDFTEDDVKEFASVVGDESDLLYRTPLEANVILKQKVGSQRKRRRFSFSDVTEITLHRWPNADDYLSKLQPYVRFIYTPWFTVLTLIAFAAMVGMWIGKFDEIWSDSFRFYNFKEKTTTDLIEFWFLFGAMAFFHETAHGMTCKHFGGAVERMEFLLMYFAPTFMCDVTQIWVLGERRARLWTVIAGIWVDLILCFFATLIWWTTAPGMWSHDFAYKVMMVTGIGISIANLNPLIKLDGYYMFSEIVGQADLKERSTLYVSQWVKRHLFRLPVEIEYVPRRRRLFYLVYSSLSGAYGYLLIGFFVIFLYNIVRSHSPEYAWIAGVLIAIGFFRSRIRTFQRFMKDVYLDKKDRVRAWLTPARAALCSAIGLVVLLTPVWPDSVDGRFVLEPVRRAVIRAEVAGTVQQVFVNEGQSVVAGAPLMRLRNLQLESEAAEANAGVREASARAVDAQLHYSDFGSAQRQRDAKAQRNQVLETELHHLEITAPIAGVVVSPKLEDLLGRYIQPGTQVAEVADTSKMRARIYIPEYGVRDVHTGSHVRLQMHGILSPMSAKLALIAPLSSDIDPALTEKQQLSGITPPPYYIGFVTLDNDVNLREGATGTAKIFVRRRSLAALAGRFGRDLFERRFW